MTSPRPFTASQHYASLLLTAWDNHEGTDFQAVWKRIPPFDQELLSFGERERMDLIQDIASSLPLWKSSGQSEDAGSLKAALTLMRHLARGREDSVTKKTSLPTERPASALSLRCALGRKARH